MKACPRPSKPYSSKVFDIARSSTFRLAFVPLGDNLSLFFCFNLRRETEVSNITQEGRLNLFFSKT